LCPQRLNTVLVYVPTPDAEPVARVTHDGDIIETGFGLLEGTLLYTAPPKREWQGLTGLEQKELMAMSVREAVFNTEAKLKEKNNG
jgi:hypothetical protein